MKWLKIPVFFMVLSLVYLNVSPILIYDNNNNWKIDSRREQIEEEFEDVDVVFIGGSKVQTAVTPIVLWEESGLLGINIATNSQPPLMTYYLLERFVDELNPSVVVMDLPSIIREADPALKFYNNNYALALQFIGDGEIKDNALKEIADMYPDFDIRSFKYPFYKDHNRWNILSERDFKDVSNYYDFWLGGVNERHIQDPLRASEKIEIYQYESEYEFNDNSMNVYLKAIKQLEEKGIEVILMVPPSVNPKHDVMMAMHDFAVEHELKLLDYNLSKNFDRVPFEDQIDFYDNSHLSIVGAKAFSKALGNDLREFVEVKEQDQSLEQSLSRYLKEYEAYYEEASQEFLVD